MKTLIVIGNGMVGHRFLEECVSRGLQNRYRMVTFCEEPRPAYDRVHLSEYFAGKSADDLALGRLDWYRDNNIDVRIGRRAARIDREQRVVEDDQGETIAYDKLMVATGSYPFVPPVPGNDQDGCFVYRTIEDLEAMQARAQQARTGVVIGGGLLGLEAANALKNMGLETHVIEFAPQLMGLQLDLTGGTLLRDMIEDLGVRVHTGTVTEQIQAAANGVNRLRFKGGEELAAEMVVFSCGVRPRDELIRACGLSVGERGGMVVDSRCCSPDDIDIMAIGEVACYEGRCYGLVAPGYQMAAVAAAQLDGEADILFTGADLSTKLKLLGLDVASFGDSHGRTSGCRSYTYANEVDRIYKRIVVDADGHRLLGGILVGDAADYTTLHALYSGGLPLPEKPESLILPTTSGSPAMGVEALPDSATICSCNNVSKGAIVQAVQDGCHDLAGLKQASKACTGCGGCTPMVQTLLNRTMAELGLEVDSSLCEHFAHTRQELAEIIRIDGIRDFDSLIAKHGDGLGCEICKPAVASIFASIWNEHILETQHLGLQDSNDRFLANIQKDGSYSVVPRVPGGEITPDQLLVIGRVAKKYDLYTKITGGQRIDLFGAQSWQLPLIWRELIDAGFESGHAYGKAVRTVKSCVGSTWCRYGVQDSVGLAIRLEHRYKGIRAPHKLKFAVSGCTRECAEAQSKDIGVIATEEGYNLFVCGNGGMRPRHGDLLATDLDEERLIRYIDRLLIYYIRTADRLQRTSVWLENLQGGLEHLRAVVIEDRLGLAEELETQMAELVAGYRCEWAAALEQPEKIKRFASYVNTDTTSTGDYVREREQRQPA